MKQQTTQWVVDNWVWEIPLAKDFLESLPTHIIIQQLKHNEKIVISDRENIPNLTHRVTQNGRNCQVRLVFKSKEVKEVKPIITISSSMGEDTKTPLREEFEYIEREVTSHDWIGGTIKVRKNHYTFELSNMVWYDYVVRRYNGLIIEKSRRGVTKEIVDERIAYFQSITKEEMAQIREAWESL